MDNRPSIKQIVDLVSLDYRRGRDDFYDNILIEDQSPFLQSVFEKFKAHNYTYEEASSLYTLNLIRAKCQPDARRKINTVGWAKNVNRRIENAMSMYYGSHDLPVVENPAPLSIPKRPERTQNTNTAAVEETDYVRASQELDRSVLKKDILVDYSPREDLINELGLPGVLRDE